MPCGIYASGDAFMRGPHLIKAVEHPGRRLVHLWSWSRFLLRHKVVTIALAGHGADRLESSSPLSYTPKDQPTRGRIASVVKRTLAVFWGRFCRPTPNLTDVMTTTPLSDARRRSRHMISEAEAASSPDVGSSEDGGHRVNVGICRGGDA